MPRLIDAESLRAEPIIWNGMVRYMVDLNDISKAPTMKAEPVHAEWVKEEDRTNHWHCSACLYVGGYSHKVWGKYCQNCGAMMTNYGLD
jgi:hypothetical protein